MSPQRHVVSAHCYSARARFCAAPETLPEKP